MSPKVHNFYEKVPKKLLDKTLNPHYKEHKIKVPFRMLIVGSSGSGKTNTVLNLINAMPDTFMSIYVITKNADEPLYCYLQTLIDSEQLKVLEGVENIPDLDKFNKKENHLIIFDDLILDDLKTVGNYFIRARKLGVSCCFLSQSYISPDKYFKLIRRNCNYLILKKLGGMRDVNLILREYSLGIDKKSFIDLYEKATSGGINNFLMIDNESPQEERFRFNYEPICLEKEK